MMERYVKETFSKALIQQLTSMHHELLLELRNDMHKMKSELASWQSDTLRAQEVGAPNAEDTFECGSHYFSLLSRI